MKECQHHISKWTVKIIKAYNKRVKAGKEVYFIYKPLDLMFEFKYNISAKKDKQGNIYITISKGKK